MELQLQVTEEELLEFLEVGHDQINISHTDNLANKVVHNPEKKSSHQNSSRICGSHSADTHPKIKAKKLFYRQQVAHRRQLVSRQAFNCRKQKDR